MTALPSAANDECRQSHRGSLAALGARGRGEVSCIVMPALITYFRTHPWQRRLFTVSLAIMLGAAAAVLCLPRFRDAMIIRDMDSPDAKVRTRAVMRAVTQAGEDPATVGRLESALDGASDRQFKALVRALQTLGRFDVPGRNPLLLDRMTAYEVADNPSAPARGAFLVEIMTGGRDNQYVRRALKAASADANQDVRALAGMLAARLGDDDTLGHLVRDADPDVAEAATIDAAIARRKALLPDIGKYLADANGPRLPSAAALALAAMDPNAAAATLPAMLSRAVDANDPALRDRLLDIMGNLSDDATARAVMATIDRADKAGLYPPAAALLAAGRRKLPAAAPAVRKVLADSVKMPRGLLISQVHAAILAANDLKLPVRKAANDICRKLWNPRPGFRLMLTDAARLLGRQVAAPQGDQPDVPDPNECVRTLRQAVVADYEPTTWPASQPKPKPARTPLPSAAAAVALWKLDTKAAEEFIQVPAWDYVSLAGDCVAWNIGITGTDRAFALGLSLLPAANAPPELRVYNDDARSTGAVLLAIAAATPQRRKQAAERILSRLEAGPRGKEDSFYVRGAYQCALAILRDPGAADQALRLLETGQFSQRRAITALTLTGDLRGLDWLLWNRQVDREDMLLLLVDEQLGEVIAGCLPQLPAISPAAGADLGDWQLMRLRHAYEILRPGLKPQLQRK
jgi:hypothetical protein